MSPTEHSMNVISRSPLGSCSAVRIALSAVVMFVDLFIDRNFIVKVNAASKQAISVHAIWRGLRAERIKCVFL